VTDDSFNGLGMGPGNLSRLSNAKSRSISAENFSGEKGKGGMNSYWEMPFRKSARLTIENLGEQEVVLYYQIDYVLTEVAEDMAYFHAQWRRSNPLPYKEVHTILDGVKGKNHNARTLHDRPDRSGYA